jgi:hypothetical protein
MPKPQNISQLRDQLLEAFALVQIDPTAFNQVSHQVKAAGAVIASLKCELEYAALRRDNPYIAFLHYPEREAHTIEHPTERGHRLLKEIHREVDPALPA